MNTPRVGIIAGTGFSRLDTPIEPLDIHTPYGDVRIDRAPHDAYDAYILRRHGTTHNPPHRINHHANIDALARCRVDAILAIHTVGALDDTPPGTLVIPHDYIDFAPPTYHHDQATHIDVTDAYCPHLRTTLLRASNAHDGGIYATTRGPRLETRAEIHALQSLGATLVGMTGAAEATLAREHALCYASLCLITNPAVGLSTGPLHASTLKTDAALAMPNATNAVLAAAGMINAARDCTCRDALVKARL